MKQRGLMTRDATAALRDLRQRVEKERQKTARALNHRLGALQARMAREGRVWARTAEETVDRALTALNIPSRQEVARLTRKVEELTRQIGGHGRRRPARAR
jgi:hypothetical protein